MEIVIMSQFDPPERYKAMYRRAMSGKSPRTAILVHCTACMGWEGHEVPKCTAPNCPLFPYRLSAAQRYRRRKKDGFSATISVSPGAENATDPVGAAEG